MRFWPQPMTDVKSMSLQKSAPIDGVLIGAKPEPVAANAAIDDITAVQTPALPAATAPAPHAVRIRGARLLKPVCPPPLRLALPTRTVALRPSSEVCVDD